MSLPIRSEGHGRGKAFLYGSLSGIVEPIAGGITILLAAYITPILPYLLAFAAGAMIYVVVEELIPESAEGEHSNIGTIGFAVGFVLMMILDVCERSVRIGGIMRRKFQTTLLIFLAAGLIPPIQVFRMVQKATYFCNFHRQCNESQPQQGRIVNITSKVSKYLSKRGTDI